eukprot:tig00001467_g8775.t1
MKAQGGQRIWTAMIYLNDVEEGGETWFPAPASASPHPRPADRLNNLAADGSPNDATLHEARPVLGGTKYIITKWFRERPDPTGAGLLTASPQAQIGRLVAKLENNPHIRRAKVENAQMFTYPDFLSEAECDMLVALIEAAARPSTLLAMHEDPEFRTSSSTIWTAVPRALRLFPRRRNIGQMVEYGGQRTWTAMIYLNEVDEGGATWFRAPACGSSPERADADLNNMMEDGTPNYDTLHEGMRVLEGTKYIVTKWFRENAWIRAMCRPIMPAESSGPDFPGKAGA